jgi:hypothetical protein
MIRGNFFYTINHKDQREELLLLEEELPDLPEREEPLLPLLLPLLLLPERLLFVRLLLP